MTGLARRGGRSRVSATPGRSPQRSRQRVARGMVTVEMAVSLIAATLVVATSCWVVGLVVVEDACRTTAAQVARQVARGDTASAWQAESTAPTGGIYNHIRRLGERDRSGRQVVGEDRAGTPARAGPFSDGTGADMMNLVLSRIRSRGTKAGGERGSGTLLLAAVGVGFIAAVWMSLLITGWWSATHRAEETSDMAALAAGGAQAVGEPGCPVAERTVKANGAELVSCVVHNTESGSSVTVEVGVQLHRGWELPGMPTRVVKSSRAGPME